MSGHQTRLFEKRVKSISYSEDEIILDILRLHSPEGTIDLDPTYSIGQIYQGRVPQPTMKSDINPQIEGVEQYDCRYLPISNDKLGCILFDPPFVISMGEAKPANKMTERFTGFTSWDELTDMYSQALDEFYRVLRRGGIIIFKCQDVLNGDYQFFTHVAVMQLAASKGYYIKDLFIFLNKTRMRNQNGRQRHASKHHSYYWVLQKSPKRVYYITA